MQLRKQAEVELGEKIRELREELGACQESKRKLEGTVGVVLIRYAICCWGAV